MRGKTKHIRVSHETVLVSTESRPLHVLTLRAAKRGSGVSDILTGFLPEASGAYVEVNKADNELRRFADYVSSRWEDGDWRAPIPGAAYTAREYEIGVRMLLHEIRRIAWRPDRLARAAMASLIASPPVFPETSATDQRTPGQLVSVIAASLLSRILEEGDEVRVSPPQLRMLLTIASDSARLRNSPTARLTEKEFRRHEIPYALSPRTRADRLDEVIGSARAVVLLPLSGGAIEATTSLGQGQFLAAGEYALGGAVISMVLAAGVALAERAMAAGQRRDAEEPVADDDRQPPET